MRILLFILIISNLGCKTSESLFEKNNNDVFFSNTLYPIKYDKLWGYADFFGNTIIHPKFEEASLFQYGTAIVKLNNRYGYITNTGQWLIKPKYRSAEPFYLRYYGIKSKDGTGKKNLLAKVNEGNGNYYINSDGVTIKKVELFNEIVDCKPILSRLKDYSVGNLDGTYELKYEYWKITSDTSGYKVIDTTNLKIDTIIELSSDFALLKKNSKYAIYCNKTSKGIDVVNNERYLIPKDSVHKVMPNFIYDDVKFKTSFGEEKPTSIFKKKGRWGIVSVSGQELVPFLYLDIVQIENNSSFLVEFEENKFGYISTIFESSQVYNARENKKTNGIVREHFKRKKSK